MNAPLRRSFRWANKRWLLRADVQVGWPCVLERKALRGMVTSRFPEPCCMTLQFYDGFAVCFAPGGVKTS